MGGGNDMKFMQMSVHVWKDRKGLEMAKNNLKKYIKKWIEIARNFCKLQQMA